MTIDVPKRIQSHILLNRILDQPELPAIIRSLDAGVLARLIRHIGLEDSAEIVSLADTDQLKSILDEDLWYSEAPGQDEVFDADRFGLWLEILLETNAAFAARKVRELDEGLLTLGLCQLILVVDLDELALYLSRPQRSTGDNMLDKILESTLSQEFDGYLALAKSDRHWDAIQALLVELDELDHTMLGRLLERCQRISFEYIEDNGGLFDVLTSEEMLESDLAADREARREAEGFVAPSNARYFLNRVRLTDLERIVRAKTLDPVTRAIFNTAGEKEGYNGKLWADGRPAGKASPERTAEKVVPFLQALQAAAVLPGSYQMRLGGPKGSVDGQLPLVNVLRTLRRTEPTAASKYLTELTGLSNILISGCGFQGRSFRPAEAAEAAISVCNLGSEYFLDIRTGEGDGQSDQALSVLLAEQGLVKFFQVGWKLLYEAVVLYTARALLQFLDRQRTGLQDAGQAWAMGRMADRLETEISSGRPWEFNGQLDQLLGCLDAETVAALTALLQEYPTLPEALCRQGRHPHSAFIGSRAHIRAIRKFLKRALRVNEEGERQTNGL